ncbi:MAG: cyclase family protein, partial [Deltaproteobacteria bacterium]|nr:cyclase family protein [Deltaproteobacteria bacterium]
FPSHFLPQGKTLDQYPVSRFFCSALVLPVDQVKITPNAIKNHRIEPGDALLFQTGNSVNGLSISGMYTEDYVYLSPEAAQCCVDMKISLVGIDYISVDPPGDDGFPAHHLLLENDILILEGINLRDVPPGRYSLICLPLKISAGEASPVRAVLMADAMV